MEPEKDQGRPNSGRPSHFVKPLCLGATMSLPNNYDEHPARPPAARPLPARHPHRLNALGISPARDQSIESVKNSLAALDGTGLRAALQVLTVVELLAVDDVDGALEALDEARDEVRGLQ